MLQQRLNRLISRIGFMRTQTPEKVRTDLRHHVAITGTGRAGTTFLIQLFTQLGFDTGFENLTKEIFSNCNAGMEKNLASENCPHVIKDPMLCRYLDSFLESDQGKKVVVDHLIVPVRDLHSAAESRRDVNRRTDPALYPLGAPGGIWLTSEPSQQEAVLQGLLYDLVFAAAKWSIPVILLHFPRITRDPEYLYERLRPVLGDMKYKKFLKDFKKVAKPELVHNFQPVAQASDRLGYRNNSA